MLIETLPGELYPTLAFPQMPLEIVPVLCECVATAFPYRVNLLRFHKSACLEASGRIIHLSPVRGQGPRLT